MVARRPNYPKKGGAREKRGPIAQSEQGVRHTHQVPSPFFSSRFGSHLKGDPFPYLFASLYEETLSRIENSSSHLDLMRVRADCLGRSGWLTLAFKALWSDQDGRS